MLEIATLHGPHVDMRQAAAGQEQAVTDVAGSVDGDYSPCPFLIDITASSVRVLAWSFSIIRLT